MGKTGENSKLSSPAKRYFLIVFVSVLLIAIAPTIWSILVPSSQHYYVDPIKLEQLSTIRKAGEILFSYANNHNGRYPDDLEKFLAEDCPASQRELFYKQGMLRWRLTPGLTTRDKIDTVLLESIANPSDGRIIYTVNNFASFIKNKKNR